MISHTATSPYYALRSVEPRLFQNCRACWNIIYVCTVCTGNLYTMVSLFTIHQIIKVVLLIDSYIHIRTYSIVGVYLFSGAGLKKVTPKLDAHDFFIIDTRSIMLADIYFCKFRIYNSKSCWKKVFLYFYSLQTQKL